MLTEELTKLEKQIPGECKIAEFKKSDPESGEVLQRLLDGRVSIRKIHHALRNENVTIGRETLSTHRNQKCGCYT
jgi:hypothetical protein